MLAVKLPSFFEEQCTFLKLSGKTEDDEDGHQKDSFWTSEKFSLKRLDPGSEELKVIEKFIYSSSTTENRRVDVLDVLEIEQHGRSQMEYPGDKYLLWHGTQKRNLKSILENGLRLHPDGRDVSHLLFGNGIYFADAFEKSYQYCSPNITQNLPPCAGEYHLFLCEVSPGKLHHSTIELRNEEPKRVLKSNNCDSVLAIGKSRPKPAESVVLNGLIVPCGEHVEHDEEHAVEYNEYVIYEKERVMLKYLVKVRGY